MPATEARNGTPALSRARVEAQTEPIEVEPFEPMASDTSRMVLPVGLTALQAVDSDAGVYPILMAGAVFVILPVLLIFVLLQRYLVAGLTQGAVK